MPPNPEPTVSLEVDGKEITFWQDLTLSMRVDGFDTASFSAPFNPERKDMRDLFRPFSYQDVVIKVDGEQLFTGTLMGVDPESDYSQTAISLECASRGAVLADTSMPVSTFPLEFAKVTLMQVAQKLCEPFGITAVLDSDAGQGPAFDKVKIGASDKVGDFLADLAKQRGLVLSSTEEGGIVFRQSGGLLALPPVARLIDGQQPVIRVTPTFSPQAYFSEVTCISKTKRGRYGDKYTEANPFYTGKVKRPGVIQLEDTDKGDIEVATRAAIGRMYGNAAGYEVEVCTWLRPTGTILYPGDAVTLLAPRAMVYKETELVVRTVDFHLSATERTATLGLMLPGAFSGEIPEAMPWDE